MKAQSKNGNNLKIKLKRVETNSKNKIDYGKCLKDRENYEPSLKRMHRKGSSRNAEGNSKDLN